MFMDLSLFGPALKSQVSTSLCVNYWGPRLPIPSTQQAVDGNSSFRFTLLRCTFVAQSDIMIQVWCATFVFRLYLLMISSLRETGYEAC
jgi:hypothetical protein